jgi:hypothetical protein
MTRKGGISMTTRDTLRRPQPRRILVTRIAFLLFAACSADRVTAAGDLFKTNVESMSVTPLKPRVGESSVITCRWSAKFFAPVTNEKKTVFEIAPAPLTHVTGDFSLKYQGATSTEVAKSFDSLAKPGYYTKDQPLKGEFKLNWVPSKSGAALVACIVSGPHDDWQQRSKQQLPLWIDPPKHEIAGATDAASSGVFVTPPARLSIEGATAMLTGNCSGKLPRAVAVIKLQLRNSGKALPPGRGIASAKCCSGLLANPGVYLPAIGPGETTVDVPVGFTESIPNASVYLLAAPRTFTILVKPTNADTFAAPNAHMLTITFPPGKCGTPSRSVAPAQAPPAVRDNKNSSRRDP